MRSMASWPLVALMIVSLARPASATIVEDLNEAGKAAYTRGDYAQAERSATDQLWSASTPLSAC